MVIANLCKEVVHIIRSTDCLCFVGFTCAAVRSRYIVSVYKEERRIIIGHFGIEHMESCIL